MKAIPFTRTEHFLRFISCFVLVFTCLLDMYAQDIKSLEVTKEVEDTGKIIYTFRFTPGKTQTVEDLVFDCQYHQEFPVLQSDGKKQTKIHEPETFTYKRKNEKFVDDLDNYINFRVPLALQLLKPIYGDRTFNEDYPVSISEFRITARNAGKKIWSFKVKPDSNNKWDAEKKTLVPVEQ